jgi:hypothetical protein
MIASTTKGFFHPRSASNFLTNDFSFPRLSIALPPAKIGGGKVIDVRGKVAVKQKTVKRARIQRG